MWQLNQIRRLCYAPLALALLLLASERLVADDAADRSAASFTAPAAFQSPLSGVRSLTNTAAAIDNGSAAVNSHAANATTSGEAPVPANSKPQLPIARDGRSAPRLPQSVGKESSGSKNSGTQSFVTILGSLGIVLGLFFVTMWLCRGSAPKSAQNLPAEVVEPLGRTSVAKGRQLQLFRFGNKLVLVSVSPNGFDTISEITDPVEVDRISGLCLRNGALSSTQAFRTVLDSFAGRGAGERAGGSRGRTTSDQATSWERTRGRLREDDDDV